MRICRIFMLFIIISVALAASAIYVNPMAEQIYNKLQAYETNNKVDYAMVGYTYLLGKYPFTTAGIKAAGKVWYVERYNQAGITPFLRKMGQSLLDNFVSFKLIHRIVMVLAAICFVYLLPHTIYPRAANVIFSLSFVLYFHNFSPMFDSDSELSKLALANNVFFIGVLGYVLTTSAHSIRGNRQKAEVKAVSDKTVDNLPASKIKYAALLEFVKDLTSKLNSMTSSISEYTRKSLILELERLGSSFKALHDEIVNKLKDTIEALQADLSALGKDIDRIEGELSENEILKKEKVIKKKEFKEKQKMLQIELSAAQQKKKGTQVQLDLLLNPDKKIMKTMQRDVFKEETLAQQWQLTYQSPQCVVPFEPGESEKGKKTMSRIKKLNKEISNRNDKLSKLDKTKVKLTPQKYGEKYSELKGELDRYKEELSSCQKEVWEKIGIINDEINKREEILKKLETELTDYQSLKKMRGILLTKFIGEKLSVLPLDIKKAKAELKILMELRIIYDKS